MAECQGCGREMFSAASCGIETLLIDGVLWRRLASADEPVCHDCNVPPGGIHHVFCDREECPSCGGQLIACEHADTLREAVGAAAGDG